MLVLDALFDHIQQISSHVEIIGRLVQRSPVSASDVGVGSKTRNFGDQRRSALAPKEDISRVDALARKHQLASLRSFANGLRPSQVCIEAASDLLPVRIMRWLTTAARTVSSPIQIAVMLRRSTET
jgi:hypothetical protein